MTALPRRPYPVIIIIIIVVVVVVISQQQQQQQQLSCSVVCSRRTTICNPSHDRPTDSVALPACSSTDSPTQSFFITTDIQAG